MSGASQARVLLTTALLAFFAPVHAEAEPIATEVTTLDLVWSFAVSVYESSAPDNPAPQPGELTYVYQLTALRSIPLTDISIAYQGQPATDLGFVAGSGDASPNSLYQGGNGRWSGVSFYFWYTRLEALQKTDLLYFLSEDRPGFASFTVQDVPIGDPAALRTLGPSVAEPAIPAALVLTLAAIGSRLRPGIIHEVTRCS